MKQQLLLLEDVDGLGRSGDVVSAKPGFVRNFLLPQKKAVVADTRTLRMQTRLKEERLKKATIDQQEGEALAARLNGFILPIVVKVDPDGKMYGSVSTHDIARLLQENGFEVERKYVVLIQPIKVPGTYQIQLKLKEGVPASFTLEITPEGMKKAE